MLGRKDQDVMLSASDVVQHLGACAGCTPHCCRSLTMYTYGAKNCRRPRLAAKQDSSRS